MKYNINQSRFTIISRKRADNFKANSQHSFWRHPKVSRFKRWKFFQTKQQILLVFFPCTFIVILERNINLGPTGARHSFTMIHLTSLLSFNIDMLLIFHFRFSASWRMPASILLGKDVLTFSSAIYCTAGNRPQWNIYSCSYSPWVHVQNSEFLPAVSESLFVFLFSPIIPRTGTQRCTLILQSIHAML